MTISLLHLNILGGKFLDTIIDYIQDHQFDILQFQEVSGGEFNQYGHKDLFTQIKDRLDYNGVLTRAMTKPQNAASYEGNATFFKNSFTFKHQNVVWLQPFAEMEKLAEQIDEIKKLPRNALHLQLSKGGQIINLINAHLTWGPTPQDEPYKVEQGEILYKYLQTVPHSFILTGDFNVTPNSHIVQSINQLARNLTVENNLTNTLNPRTHRAPQLFPPGLAVDYVYVTKDITVKNFSLIDKKNLSDHFGLSITFEV